MKILAIDLGAGTEDILLFDSNQRIENSVSLVLPTPSRFLAARLRKMEGHVFIHGDTIGGGALTGAIVDHLKKGCRVVMTEGAAFSVRNDLAEVGSLGIEVSDRPSVEGFRDFEIREIDLAPLKSFLGLFGEDLDVDVVAVAVQDHGVAPAGMMDRVFRFNTMEAMLRKDNRPESFHYSGDAVPAPYLRMRSSVAAVRRSSAAPVVVMDTALCAILGCLEEVTGPSLVVNVGNGHTIAALVVKGRIEALYEHHTHQLTPEKLERDLRRLVRGELAGREVLDDGGHGAVTLNPFEGETPAVVTGPNRALFRKTSMAFHFAAPAGSTMMTGPMGLVRAAQFRFGGG